MGVPDVAKPDTYTYLRHVNCHADETPQAFLTMTQGEFNDSVLEAAEKHQWRGLEPDEHPTELSIRRMYNSPTKGTCKYYLRCPMMNKTECPALYRLEVARTGHTSACLTLSSKGLHEHSGESPSPTRSLVAIPTAKPPLPLALSRP